MMIFCSPMHPGAALSPPHKRKQGTEVCNEKILIICMQSSSLNVFVSLLKSRRGPCWVHLKRKGYYSHLQ